MKAKTILTVLLLAFVAASITVLVFKGERGTSGRTSDAVAMESKPAGTEASGKVRQKGHQVIAYYFHTTFRCATCYRIEQLTSEAIHSGFPGELKNGSLQWKPVNVEEAGNDHFAKDYGLFTKSVVLVEMNEGEQVKWKNLKEIWKLVDKKDAFTKYIQDETRSFLGKN